MEPQILFPYGQEPTTGPYHDPNESSQHLPVFLGSILILSFMFFLGG